MAIAVAGGADSGKVITTTTTTKKLPTHTYHVILESLL